jgi:hypothetical protein
LAIGHIQYFCHDWLLSIEQVAPIDRNPVELHDGGHRAGGRSLFARNVRRLLISRRAPQA